MCTEGVGRSDGGRAAGERVAFIASTAVYVDSFDLVSSMVVRINKTVVRLLLIHKCDDIYEDVYAYYTIYIITCILTKYNRHMYIIILE